MSQKEPVAGVFTQEELMKTQDVKIIKLKSSGDELIARFGHDSLNHKIVLNNPMIIQVVVQPGGHTAIAMRPWILSSSDENFTIDSDEVLTKCEPSNEMEEQFISAVTDPTL